MSSDLAQARKKLAYYAKNPVAFVREVIGVEPDEWQAEALNALVDEDRIAVRSGHGVGKSALASWVILWWHATNLPAKTACTAPTAHQLEDILWSELAMWKRKMPAPWPAQFDITKERMQVKGAGEESFAVARVARRENPDALQGFHSPAMLFVIDEASGVDEKVFEVASGALSTEGAKIIMFGNPTKRSGYFFEAFHKHRALWHCIKVSSLDAKMASPEYAREMEEKYGKDSDIYRVRVLGEFPHASSVQFIGQDVVDACVAYRAEGYEGMPKVLAVDVARFGDDKSVVGMRQGRKLAKEHLRKFHGLDLMTLAEHVRECIDEWEPDAIVIDDVGIGAGLTDRLRQLNYKVTAFNGGMKAFKESDYANRRAEVWGLMRDALVAGFDLPDDEDLLSDLVGPEYFFTPKQQIALERKEDMKKRGLASPDVADMLSMTFAVSPRAKGKERKRPAFEFEMGGAETLWMAN